jgi:hypothetical protein
LTALLLPLPPAAFFGVLLLLLHPATAMLAARAATAIPTQR